MLQETAPNVEESQPKAVLIDYRMPGDWVLAEKCMVGLGLRDIDASGDLANTNS